MKQPTPQDLHALLQCLREVYAACNLTQYPHQITAALRQLIPCDDIRYDPSRGFAFSRDRGQLTSRERALLTLLHPHLTQAYRNAQRVTQLEQAISRKSNPPPPPVEHLTPREGQILHWVAQGKTNPEIAIIVGCSPRTVQKHLEHIFQKLGVETRTTAALRALEMGIPGVPSRA